MKTFTRIAVAAVVAGFGLFAGVAIAQTGAPAASAAQGMEKLKALEGEWIDTEGVFGTKGAVAVTYKVTAGGHTVVETFPVNTPYEMVTVYHIDGQDLVLTHYCSGGTQPRMKSKGLSDNVLAFDFDGGANIDPAKTSHMHTAKLEFISPDEIRGTWVNWDGGKPDANHQAVFRVVRKKN